MAMHESNIKIQHAHILKVTKKVILKVIIKLKGRKSVKSHVVKVNVTDVIIIPAVTLECIWTLNPQFMNFINCI